MVHSTSFVWKANDMHRDRVAFRVLIIACLVGLSSADRTASAQAVNPLEGRVDAHLAAGEFGPAMQAATAATDPLQRDRLLAAVAQAQAASGARRAAGETLASLSDDRLRSRAVDRIAATPVANWPARGGGTQADFDTLIDLVTSTIAPQTWDTVGGPGAIDSFPGGVYVDSGGLMKRITFTPGGQRLAMLRGRAITPGGNADVRQNSALRKVSLRRLERELQLRDAFGQPPTESMAALAGLQRVQYVFVYPDTGDIVIAGPAGDWTLDAEGRRVSVTAKQPVLHLDDFVVVLRNVMEKGGQFTCSITPRQANLAAAKQYLEESAKQPLRPGQRDAWLARVRDLLGRQDITVEGIDAATRVARVIVEADYRMKLVGMGLEDGVLGVTSYLDSIEVPAGSAPPPMSVLRWWFTMNYGALKATPDRAAFELTGQGVRVLSENELLTEQGKRVHTGASDELNREFAESFTKHFPELAAKYPIYAELRNVFDLALIAALLRAEDLPGQVGWHLTYFGNSDGYQIQRGAAATEVETVINHRVIHRKHIVAGVSGGVSVNVNPYVRKSAIAVDDYGSLQAERMGAVPEDLPAVAWWWD